MWDHTIITFLVFLGAVVLLSTFSGAVYENFEEPQEIPVEEPKAPATVVEEEPPAMMEEEPVGMMDDSAANALPLES